ncbi:carboxynorspermidine decarboxylase [Butyrivibrio sp. XB500-5]|uniref:carboxynorspermidine decarboxylase n=1 Tax=Butyrivibrio sp. XB500-5 TaxID=2364880 RepID=UPI000EA89617|nr:carboxynorspermidine decarboxylase [Butyrivibrio sp. XB500-5]RKM56959.1 carboxynorspermidine decarboxylase [Butyrivibrio sp. XB500-5]
MKISEITTPAYVIDEKKLKENLEILSYVQKESGAKILLAQKAFSAYKTYPMIGEYLSGATASGLYEARLAKEEMIEPLKGKRKIENHVFEPAFNDDEIKELCEICDHMVFNSLTQLEHHREVWEKNVKNGRLFVGLRINPEYSTQEGHEIYDPCASGSRLGIRNADLGDKLPKGVSGLHFHTLCEQGFEPLEKTFLEVESSFKRFFPTRKGEEGKIKWINLGGGHHITKEDYDREGLIKLVKRIKDTYGIEVYLEPGEAIALDAGLLVTTVMDIVKTEKYPVLILDTSAACHMPDVLEMPYRPPLRDSGEAGELANTYRLSSRTCLAGDIIGDYSFDKEIGIGDRLYFEDMAIYSMVKNNTFNGMPLPDIDIMHDDGEVEVLKRFGYDDFKMRL